MAAGPLRVHKVYVAPGNGGTQRAEQMENIALTNAEELADFVQREGIALTVVGPEAPLAAGVVDVFRARGLKIFGPTKAARSWKLEGLRQGLHGPPQHPDGALRDLHRPGPRARLHRRGGRPIVIKADGLAAGKGVVVAATLEEAHAAVDAMLGDGSMGEAGARVVIEECLVGEEASFIVMCDGRNVLALATSQDHKRLQDGDQGPNTGGMGAYSPAPIVTPELHHRIMREIILPTVQGMTRDGIPYTGFLYAGLMIAPAMIRPRHQDAGIQLPHGRPGNPAHHDARQSDLLDALEHAVDGTLDQADITWDRRTALGVVLASHNYPNTPRTGDVIRACRPTPRTAWCSMPPRAWKAMKSRPPVAACCA